MREHSSKTSTTAAGRSEKSSKAPVDDSLIDVINQVFTLFRINYHNQYYAAFNEPSQLNQAKRLWLESLSGFSQASILTGAKSLIEKSEYLPSLARMIEACHAAFSDLGLPSARDAYLEACNARTPRSAQPWSHPAVYFAGRDSNWFFLENHSERETWPVFEQHYRKWCQRALAGEKLVIEAPAAIEKQETDMSQTERLQALKTLRENTGI